MKVGFYPSGVITLWYKGACPAVAITRVAVIVDMLLPLSPKHAARRPSKQVKKRAMWHSQRIFQAKKEEKTTYCSSQQADQNVPRRKASLETNLKAKTRDRVSQGGSRHAQNQHEAYANAAFALKNISSGKIKRKGLSEDHSARCYTKNTKKLTTRPCVCVCRES